MSTPDELLSAARALDWSKLKKLLMSLPKSERAKRIEWLVKEIRNQGYVVVPEKASFTLPILIGSGFSSAIARVMICI